PEPSLHPALAELYRERVAALHEALLDPTTQDEAFGIIRTLIDEIRLIPDDGELKIELRGALAGILRKRCGDDLVAVMSSEADVCGHERRLCSRDFRTGSC
ncbi:MAG TPA: hypothetical protein VE224_17045, partial [Pseudolabrys sp.]|nr:hypothetical protein [Pseudolabrys sp.]